MNTIVRRILNSQLNKLKQRKANICEDLAIQRQRVKDLEIELSEIGAEMCCIYNDLDKYPVTELLSSGDKND